MFFNTIQYLIFLPVVVLLFYFTQPKYRWMVLFLSSCFFYMYFIPKYILCLFFLIIVDFYAAKKIDSLAEGRKRKAFLVFSILSNFGLLFYFKYLAFFAELGNLVWLPVFGTKLSASNTLLPIGLSFHTFQSVSYVIDVYKKKLRPETHMGIYASYVLFFPQMVAGPIERYTTLGSELKKKTAFSLSFVKQALPLLIIGLFYKMVVADNCGEYVNATYLTLATQNNYNILLAVIFFCIQIYSDFFGYSLIAQGSARLFGISLIDNFAFPFFSANIVEFWKKWHMSLTSWFRDYVYIPLGGNRVSLARYAFNIMVVFTLSGLWHGAGINFILWGFFHSVAYLFFVFVFSKTNLKLPPVFGYIFTFLLAAFIFVFFRNGSIGDSLQILRGVFHNRSFAFRPVSILVLINVLFIFTVEFFVRKYYNYTTFLANTAPAKNLLLLFYMLFAILTFSGVDNLPFIYFQF